MFFVAGACLLLPDVARAEEPAPSAAPAPQAGPEACTLVDCVRLAVSRGPAMAGATAALDIAKAQKKQAPGHYLPMLTTDGNLRVWDSEQEASFGSIPGIPITVPPFKVRDQVTWNVNITIIEPLTQLWLIGHADELVSRGVEVAGLEKRIAEREQALQTTEAWLQAALTEDLVHIAESSLAARTSDAERAKVFANAGVLLAADASRADLGVLDAKQRLAQSQRQRQLARARLAQLVGTARVPDTRTPSAGSVPTNAASAPSDTPGRVPIPADLTEAKAVARAQRGELQVVTGRIRQAEAQVDLARSRLLPDVNFVAQAQFAGGSEFQGKSAAFFGVVFNWRAWDWGSTYYSVQEASARVRQAEAGLAQADEGIGLEVEAAWVELEAAREMAALSGEARRIAETHYGLVRARLDAHAVTGFDLVEAESALTKARSEERLTAAQVSIARARLVRALGGGPDDIAREGTP